MVGPDNIKQRQNLVEITTSILASLNEENIYMLIGQHIHEILSDAIIIVSKFDRINNILAVKNIQGLSSSIKFVVSVLGKNPTK